MSKLVQKNRVLLDKDYPQEIIRSNPLTDSEILAIANKRMDANDIHEEIDSHLFSHLLSNSDKLKLCIVLSGCFSQNKDNFMVLHFLKTAETFLTKSIEQEILIKQWLLLGRSDEAFDLLVTGDLKIKNFTKSEKSKLLNVYNRVRKKEIDKKEHGHHLLLDYLEKNLSKYKKILADRIPVLIEVGTTRENVSGQDSTSKIAEFCKEQNIHFITVDMDAHNTNMANYLFNQMKVPFKAINSKGEDYLNDYTECMDFVFLDAYDFDHGGHTALRQSRYKKFLGSRINEKQCYQMHLECAKNIADKLELHGIVSINDTWLVDGAWCAKGTLAVPYLLENDFEVIVAKNRSVLMKRIQN